MTNSKKILIFSTAYFPFVGGAEVAIKEITDRIGDFEFDLITARFDKKLPFREKVGNVTVYRLGIGNSFIDKLILPFEGAFFARHLLKKKSYDSFWCMMASFGSGAAYVYNIFSNKKVPIILTLQEGDSEEHFQNRWFGLINLSWKMALKRSTAVTALSNYLAERAKKFGYKKEVQIVPNGVDLEKFQNSNSKYQIEEKSKIREEIGLKDGDFALVTTSRLVKKNGLEDVIAALVRLPQNIKFVIFGEGELRSKLETLAKELNVSHRVLFKGLVSHADLPNFLSVCDIFIRPSLSEGQGVSFIEAMAAGLPVIATPVGGIPDFLKDPTSQSYDGTSKQTGLFCKVNDPESIAEKVMEYINNPELKNKIIEDARKMVEEKYDWTEIAQKMKGVLISV